MYFKFSNYVHVKICIVIFLKDSFSLGIALKRSDFFCFCLNLANVERSPFFHLQNLLEIYLDVVY